MARLNEQFTEEEFDLKNRSKQKMAKSLGLTRLNNHDFLVHLWNAYLKRK